jgi:O-acetyl-ADP-ribose deacetylase (regulator of RNase III)
VRFEVRDGDIAAVEADAVANAANDRLWMGAGVAGALKRAGGDEIEREATALGPFQRWQDPSWKRMTVSLR